MPVSFECSPEHWPDRNFDILINLIVLVIHNWYKKDLRSSSYKNLTFQFFLKLKLTFVTGGVQTESCFLPLLDLRFVGATGPRLRPPPAPRRPASTPRAPDSNRKTQEGREGRAKEHGIWGVILFVFGVTCATERRLSATVCKLIGGTNSSLIVIPPREQSVSPAECWRGDRLPQDDNWKESGWSSLAPVALGDGRTEPHACFGGGRL